MNISRDSGANRPLDDSPRSEARAALAIGGEKRQTMPIAKTSVFFEIIAKPA